MNSKYLGDSFTYHRTLHLQREFLERAPEPTSSGNRHKENSLRVPSNPCHDLVFTHEEQIPRWEGGREKKPEETKRKRFGSQVKRKATSDNVRAKYYKIVNIERLKHINQG